MTRRSRLVALAMLAGAATLVAQPAKELKPVELKPADALPGLSTPVTIKPAMEPDMGEAPDGTKMPVVARKEIKLVMEDLKVGEGKEALASSTVTIHYHGTLATTGAMFDSTRGKDPATYPLRQLIAGWQMGIPGMKVGGIRVLRVPYQLAYGERAVPGEGGKDLIPAKSDLVFAIELRDVK